MLSISFSQALTYTIISVSYLKLCNLDTKYTNDLTQSLQPQTQKFEGDLDIISATLTYTIVSVSYLKVCNLTTKYKNDLIQSLKP